ERGWPFYPTRAASRLLKGQTVLLLSFGHIARRIAELLAPLGMNLVAVRRRVVGDEPIRVLPESEMDSLLPTADHIINVLPASAETKNFLNAERLSLVKPGAILYNVGRGTTVDQTALREALLSGRLAAAYLDVTEPEPLPPDDPLWTTPNCFITPHSGGGHSDEMERLVDHFLENFRRFAGGHELLNRVA
ncbi:MAG: D-2-hydroxyacid dehydrogenase, partial [Acidobacteria bacterium]|nr:D-2-hydroxyacid dehydrogenase [Acidobacteriota bacterium]